MSGRLLIVALAVLGGGFAEATVRLNEIVASNGTTIADNDGDFSDWIELHNTGSSTVDLSGWGLSDAPATPFKWTFPAGITLAANSYRIVWASGKNRTAPAAPLHTGFSISAAGESIALTRPVGVTADQVDLPALPRNVSYGRLPGQGTSWFFFHQTTPGAANTTQGYATLPPRPVFSTVGGFFTGGFALELGAEPGWTVYYTLDGSDPHPLRTGTGKRPYRESHTYAAPIAVASRAGAPNVFSMIPTTKYLPEWLPEWRAPNGEVFKATVVRAAAYETASGRLGPTVTHTYFVDPGIHARYRGLAVASLVSDHTNLFASATGIYVPGSATTQAQQNFMKDWTRKANLEFFETGGTPAFSDIFDIKIQGSSSKTSMQKGIHVEVGESSLQRLIEYPLFGARGTSASGVASFNRFILRAWGSSRKCPVLFSDAHNQTLVAHSDLEIQDYRPVVVFINGEYWGLHELREANKNSWYHQFRTGIGRDDPGYDLLDRGGTIVDEGDANHWNALTAYVKSNNLAGTAAYQHVTARVDVENLSRYIAHCIFSGKRDWPQQNESLWRPRLPDGRWRWTQFDMDQGFLSWSRPAYNMFNQTVDATGDPETGYGPHDLLRRLLANAEFKRLFVNTCLDWLNSYYLTEVELAHFDALKAELDPFITEFNNRWPIATDAYYKGWQGGINYGRGLIAGSGSVLSRRAYRRNQLSGKFSIGSERQLTLLTDPATGLIRCNSLVIDATLPGVNPAKPYPWQRSYYQNYPVTLRALPKAEHRFLGWIVRRDGAKLPALPGGDATYYSSAPSIDLALAVAGSYSAEAVFEPLTFHDLHVWNFNAGLPETPSYTIGGGLLSAAPSSAGSVILNAASSGFDSSHLRVNEPLGASLHFALPTTGHEWPVLRLLTRRSGQGAGTQHYAYTLDGATWIVHSSLTVEDADPQPVEFDFSAIPGAVNNPRFGVKVTFSQGSGGSAGNNRFDDVTLAAVRVTGFPAAIATPPDRKLTAAGPPLEIDLSGFFVTGNGNTPVFVVSSDAPGVAGATLDGPVLTLSGLSSGEATVSVSPLYQGEPAGETRFRVMVYPQPFSPAGSAYRFHEWSAAVPAGSHPPHMLFLQSGQSDPGRHTALDAAYAIPAVDAAVPADAYFPYAATARTRINGLAENGVSFINTGRNRDVGAALLAIDTTGLSTIRMKWTAGTVQPNTRVYALTPQYRLGIDGPWTDLPGGVAVEYTRHPTAGHQRSIGPITLPAELENQPVVQIQWRYHHISGTSGPRAEIRLDDIVLTAGESYDNWAALRFAAGELADPLVVGPLADFAGDGTPNLVKYALGLAPGAPVTADHLRIDATAAGAFLARFRLDRSLGDIAYLLQRSPDLANWSETVYDSRLDPGPNSHGASHEVPVAPSGAARGFIRLAVIRE